jgi:hypothetical protein
LPKVDSLEVSIGARLLNATSEIEGYCHPHLANVCRVDLCEDTFKRLLLRFERIQQQHYGMKLMAYTLMNLRAFCRT